MGYHGFLEVGGNAIILTEEFTVCYLRGVENESSV